MKTAILSLLLICTFPFYAYSGDAEKFAGTWGGILDVGMMKLSLVIHIKSNNGALTATLDSPDQKAFGIPVNSCVASGSNLRLELTALSGSFDAELMPDGLTLSGHWSQGGMKLPLELKKNVVPKERNRTQVPLRPFPYREAEVSFVNKNGDTLAGTLTIPEGSGPFNAVILITGSGPQNRDEELMGHKPFLVLSDYLTRNGIAVLRYDDRGIAKSKGNYATATSFDFADDAEAALTFLQKYTGVALKKIGLAGHSEGGIIAPIVASRNPDVGFLVLLAGTGVNGTSVLHEQAADVARSNGSSEKQIARDLELNKKIFTILRNFESDSAGITSQIENLLQKYLAALPDSEKLSDNAAREFVQGQLKAICSPWFRTFLVLEPAVFLEKVICPVLAINGSRDLQVSAKINLPAIESALKKSGNKNVEIVELPGLNHLFQECTTGSISEYVEIEETFSPKAMAVISAFIKKQ